MASRDDLIVPKLVPQEAPPPDYYARNLRYLLDEVEARHVDVLDAPARGLITAFRSASVPAQRLFARLVSRSGPCIRVDSLRYAEVGDLDGALAELERAGLVARNAAVPADRLLERLTRAEAAACFPRLRAARKADFIGACVGGYDDAAIRARVARRWPWVSLADPRAFHACLVTFFGGDGQDLSTFVLQDLGVLRFEAYPLDARTRAFADRADLHRYLLCRQASIWAHRLDECPALARPLLEVLGCCGGSRTVERARDRVLNRLGRWHERRGEADAALACYRRSTSHPARERRCRLLRKLGEEAGVARLLDAMARDPWAPEEEDFAARFGDRPGSRTGARNRVPPAPVSVCHLGGETPPAIEQHALSVLTAHGGRGWHLENLLPLGLAGLAYWDVVFAPVQGAFSHRFQLGPRDLFWPDFARARRELLAERHRALGPPGAFAAAVRATAASRRGVANRLVHWGAFDDALIEALLDAVPHHLLAALAAHTIANLHRSRSGFPDLLVIYGPGAWEVVEVKGPTDQLQPAQRVWLAALQRYAIPARVLRFRGGR
jgi:hypothetical protein